MLARNILDIAPEAVLWDLPLLPPRISNIAVFLSEAHAAFIAMLNDIDQRRGTWILVNAWAIFDRQTEVPFGGYTENRPTAATLHPFTQEVADAVGHKRDVIFCAGNCGEFCPDKRCGAIDRGAGRSIWGANSFYRVLTVGAARTDGAWIGYSSQGPGQPNLSPPTGPGFSKKPDLCAPSGFCEDFDAHLLNAGTSAATGVAAGVVAALRSRWAPTVIQPELLYLILNATARQPLPPQGWNERFGNGILNVPGALAILS
jgi:subtilisin family serine protease